MQPKAPHESQLLTPTLHIEVALVDPAEGLSETICDSVKKWLLDNYVTLKVGQFDITDIDDFIFNIEIADYTGPADYYAFHDLRAVNLDVTLYHMSHEGPKTLGSGITQEDSSTFPVPMMSLPNVSLQNEWNSLAFDDALPARLLRCMVRMIGIMTNSKLNLSTFNLNRLCLLHGPSGSGKSTLCRALAQKLSIRLGKIFAASVLVEINANALLSKYFGESSKLINDAFEKVDDLSSTPSQLVCVVIDEIETIAGSREKSMRGLECNDSLRATNQLLTALDRLRNKPNVIVLCTSNLVEAIDPAFLNRVDISQYIPRPSAAAIYNIFRSCLNELVRSGLIILEEEKLGAEPSASSPLAQSIAPSDDNGAAFTPPLFDGINRTIPSFAEANVKSAMLPDAPASRVLSLAHKCEGLSGRTLRRLPILGLTMHTWGGQYSLDDAVTALEAAVDAELSGAKQG